jgi:O-methyltransferase
MKAIIKLIVMLFRPHILLAWLIKPLRFIADTLSLTRWVAYQRHTEILNDFPSLKRDYQNRYALYGYLIYEFQLQRITYLEFGVAGCSSFKFWLNSNDNPDSRFYGFDTFEGLPEAWGKFKKGSMNYGIQEALNIKDSRVVFYKGMFQKTLPQFLRTQKHFDQLVIHMDADLFSSTLYVLIQLAPYLQRDDILIFDEFSVPSHEFRAFEIFTQVTGVKVELIGAVNNYLQTAFKIK